MSRPMLYATLCVLLAVLFGTSYALRKQTDKEKPEEVSAEQKEAKQKEMMSHQNEQMANEQKKRLENEKRIRAKEAAEKKHLEDAARAQPAVKINTRKTSGVDISDKWFTETPDGPAGIAQAVKEKEALDKFNAEHPMKPGDPLLPPSKLTPPMPK